MVAPTEFSNNPDANTTIGGLFVGENCPAQNLNNVVRYIAAVVRVTFDSIPSSTTYVTKSGAVFLDQPLFSGRGALLHHNDTANASGRIFVVPDGTVPSGLNNGDLVIGV